MIAVNWPAGKASVTPRERVHGGLALAVDAAQVGAETIAERSWSSMTGAQHRFG